MYPDQSVRKYGVTSGSPTGRLAYWMTYIAGCNLANGPPEPDPAA